MVSQKFQNSNDLTKDEKRRFKLVGLKILFFVQFRTDLN
jgi:hypothetical protein